MEFKKGHISCHFSGFFFFFCVSLTDILQIKFEVYDLGHYFFLEKMVTHMFYETDCRGIRAHSTSETNLFSGISRYLCL